MDSCSDPAKNLEFILLDNLPQFRSSSEEIGTRVIYNYDPLETFFEDNLADSNEQSDVNISNDIPDVHDIQLITPASNSINGVYNYLKEGTEAFHPNESNNTAYNSRTDDEQLAMIKVNNESLPVIRTHTEKLLKPSISLSNCVAVTVPKAKQLQLVYPLEDAYRPRYKSDYFPQTGAVRRPRYIADNAKNHFITLQLPTEYQHDLQNEYIRVALITIFIEGHGHYYSPYKFQKDHNDIKIPDENPIYIKVDTNRESKFVMRLQLVLIKSKLDQLNHVQPLKLFSSTTTRMQNIIHERKLTPKELINKYQLDKSHLVFTLCTKLPDGSYKLYPETTIISSIITEIPTTRKTDESTAIPTVDSTQNVCCPYCAYHFDPDTGSGSHGRNKRKTTHKTSRSCSKTTTKRYKKKNKKNG